VLLDPRHLGRLNILHCRRRRCGAGAREEERDKKKKTEQLVGRAVRHGAPALRLIRHCKI
jgi:hypothetical protein